MKELDHPVINLSIDSDVPFDPPPQYAPVESPDWWNGQPVNNTWHDVYKMRVRQFPDGQVEAMVAKDKVFTGVSGHHRAMASKRGESDNREQNEINAGRRAVKLVRLCCKTIGADRLVTLTYRENMKDRQRALADWEKFSRRLRKHVDFRYVAVLEQQERGALHFHVAVRGRQNYQLLRNIWQGVLGVDDAGRQMGQVNVRNPYMMGFNEKARNRLASYLAKYCSKSMDCRGLNERRYFRSKNIDVPESTMVELDCTNMIDAIRTLWTVLRGRNFSCVQYWLNNPLGVFWIATGPIDYPDRCPF